MIARPIICVGSSLKAWNALNRIAMKIWEPMCESAGGIEKEGGKEGVERTVPPRVKAPAEVVGSWR